MVTGGAPPDRSNPLHNFSLPGVSWESQRHMRCINTDSLNSLYFLKPPPPPPPPSKTRQFMDTIVHKLKLGEEIDLDGLMMEKHNDDMRTTETRVAVALARKEKKVVDRSTPAPSMSNCGNSNNGSVSKKRLRSGVEKKEEKRIVLVVELSQEEIMEDFLKMTNERPPRRPKKRPRNVQANINKQLPAFNLGDITLDRYKVPDDDDRVNTNKR